MAVDTTNTVTFQQVPPHRPGTSDIVNGTKTNRTAAVPPNYPAAEEYMQMTALLVAYGAMVPVARISVVGGGSPTVNTLACVRADVVPGDIVLTRNGTGDVSVVLPSSKFPSPATRAMATLNGSVSAQIAAAPITNGARVRTWNTADAATDLDFTVEIY